MGKEVEASANRYQFWLQAARELAKAFKIDGEIDGINGGFMNVQTIEPGGSGHHREACAARVLVSVATVYNTLNQFTAAGLLREVAIEGDRSFFDTNTSNHFHFYHEKEGRLFDIGTDNLEIKGLPSAPEGTEIDRIDVIVRLKKRAS